MSETQTETAPSIPNYAASDDGLKTINGISYPVRKVTFGEPRRVAQVRDLDEADQWDLSEIAGANADNIAWLSRALAASATLSIDGVPTLSSMGGGSGKMAANIRDTLRKLGRDGVMAVLRTMNASGEAGTDAAAVAGNSSAAPDSAIA